MIDNRPYPTVRNAWNLAEDKKHRAQFFTRPWYDFALRLLVSRKFDGPVVDVGCGVGEFLQLLRRAGIPATGLDGHAGQVEVVRELGFEVTVADFEKPLPLETNSCALVTLLEVIEHVALAEALLDDIRRVLRPGGFLLLTTPNFAFWQYRLRHLFGHPPVAEGVHLRFFNSRMLRSLLERNGFHIVDSASFTPATGWNALRRRLGNKENFLRVPPKLESLLAADLVFLAQTRIDERC